MIESIEMIPGPAHASDIPTLIGFIFLTIVFLTAWLIRKINRPPRNWEINPFTSTRRRAKYIRLRKCYSSDDDFRCVKRGKRNLYKHNSRKDLKF